jgi:hypothetical protein
MPTNLQWKLVASIGRTVTAPDQVGTAAFEARPSPRLYLKLGVPLDHAYVPLGLEPTATFHQALHKKLKDLGYPQVAKKMPFEIPINGLGKCLFRVRARIYAPNIVVVTFQLDIPSSLSLDTDFARLESWRSLDALKVVKDVCQFTLGVIDSGNHKQPTKDVRFRTLPAFHLTLPVDSPAAPAALGANRRQIVALLLGVRKPAGMSESLIASPLEENKELNKKVSDELLLLNKQGVLYLTASDAPHDAYADRFGRMSNLVELGCVFQIFLTEYYRIRRAAEDFGDYIFTRIRDWLEHPAAVFASSYSNRLAWEVVAKEFELDEKLAVIAGNHAVIESVALKRQALESVADNWWENPEFARVFDDAAANFSQVLGKIKDPVLRQSILLDIREAERAYESHSFKSAVVMSGSAVEAMALALLQQETNEQGLEKKGLQDYLNLLRANKLVPDTAMLELLDNSLRQWRNYIHPGKAQRTGVTITEDHAKIAVAAMNGFSKSLK